MLRSLDIIYEIPWKVQPWGNYALIRATFSASPKRFSNSVLGLITYDDFSSGVRKYTFCARKSVQEVPGNLMTKEFNCSCTSDCSIVMKIRYQIIEDDVFEDLYLCEISIG